MKSKFLRLVLLIVAVLTMTLFLSACDKEIDVSTALTIDEDFSGSRIMETGAINKSDLGGSSKSKEIMESIKAGAPDGIEVSYKEEGDKYFITFYIRFTSIENYEKKVESIIGRNTDITYEYLDTAFGHIINLEEDFTTKDLLFWVQDVIRKYDSKATLGIKYTSTNLEFDGQTYSSGTSGRINVHTTGDDTAFTSILVETYVFGLDNYSRAITFKMSQSVFDRITLEKLDLLVPFGAEGKSYVDTEAAENEQYVYQITYSGTAEDVGYITSELFPGSTFNCENIDTESSAFSANCVLAEAINFSRFPCNNKGTAKVSLVYASEYLADGEQAPASDDVVFSTNSFEVTGINETCNETNSQSSVRLDCNNVSSASVALGVTFNYGIQNITVDTTLNNDDSIAVAILLDYDLHASQMALNLAENFFAGKIESNNIENVDISTRETTQETDSGTQNYYQLKILFSGSAADVSQKMSDFFGGANNFSNIYNDKFEFTTRHNVSHRVDISSLLEYANYDGIVTYVFHSEAATFKGLDCQRYENGNTAGDPDIDIFNGKTKFNSFSFSVAGGCFRASFQASYFNVGYIIIAALIIIVLIVLFIVLLSFVARKSKARKQVETEIFRKATVERSLALAVIQNNDGTVVPLSSQALANRPGAVVESTRDDGLDEDDDEPETIWLFSTTLKLLSLIAAVLFFFPFVSVSCSNSSSTESISAFNLMIGFSRDGYTMKPQPQIALLLIIPLFIFLLLFLWNKLPKVPTAIAIIAASAISLLIILNFEAIVEEQINSMMEFTNNTGSITSYTLEWAYSYSIIVYILLLIGSIVLLLAEISDKVRKKFK